VKQALMFVYLLALCSPTVFAQTGERPRSVHITETSAIHVPPQEIPAGLETIYSNLGSSKNLYNDQASWVVSGPNSSDTESEFVGMPFTPKSDSHVSQVRVPLYYFRGASNQVNLSIYGNTSSGHPGRLLAGPVTVTNLPDAGTCCALAVANFTPVAVTGGRKYWVVANTPLTGTGSDFYGGWNEVAAVPLAFNIGSGWYAQNVEDQDVAGEVLGTIP